LTVSVNIETNRLKSSFTDREAYLTAVLLECSMFKYSVYEYKYTSVQVLVLAVRVLHRRGE